ncbi:C-type lectin domain family 10 member A-like isoform 2-T2 [Discoglossus pictus]
MQNAQPGSDEHEYGNITISKRPQTKHMQKNLKMNQQVKREEPAETHITSVKNVSNKSRLRILLVTLLIFVFLLFIILTILVFVFYNNILEENSKLRHHLEERRQHDVNISGEMSEIKQTLSKITQTDNTCPPDWKMQAFSCYYFSTGIKTWVDAKKDCAQRSAKLAILASEHEMNVLQRVLKGRIAWLGLEKVSDTWKWLDGTTQNLKWAPGQPDNYKQKESCGELMPAGLNDHTCNFARRHYICMKSIIV